MPSVKAKTHKGIKKRFKVTATGKVTHKRCGSSHLNSHKSGSKIRKLRRKSVIGAESAISAKLRRATLRRETLASRRAAGRLASEIHAEPESAANANPENQAPAAG